MSSVMHEDFHSDEGKSLSLTQPFLPESQTLSDKNGTHTTATESACQGEFDSGPNQRRFRLAHFRTGLNATIQDLETLRTVEWRTLLGRVVLHFPPIAALLGLFAGLLRVSFGRALTPSSACLPDGSFDPAYTSYNPWAAGGIFQITVGYGRFPFSTAKLIDIFWDMVGPH